MEEYEYITIHLFMLLLMGINVQILALMYHVTINFFVHVLLEHIYVYF